MPAFQVWVTHSLMRLCYACSQIFCHLPPPLPMDARPSSPSRASHHDCNITRNKMTATTTPRSAWLWPRHHKRRNDGTRDIHAAQRPRPRHHTHAKMATAVPTHGTTTVMFASPPTCAPGITPPASQFPCFRKHSLSLLRRPRSSFRLATWFPKLHN